MKTVYRTLLLCASLLITQSIFAANANSPVGYWQTIDDATGKPKAIVHIWENSNKKLVGQIMKIWPRPGYDQNELCEECSGDKHNQKIVGMMILEGFTNNKKNPNEWVNGSILDPHNGRTYNCNMQTVENNTKLKVRGYIGIPLFGRSQTWVRVEK